MRIKNKFFVKSLKVIHSFEIKFNYDLDYGDIYGFCIKKLNGHELDCWNQNYYYHIKAETPMAKQIAEQLNITLSELNSIMSRIYKEIGKMKLKETNNSIQFSKKYDYFELSK